MCRLYSYVDDTQSLKYLLDAILLSPIKMIRDKRKKEKRPELVSLWGSNGESHAPKNFFKKKVPAF